eukprot:NODE_1136_length_1086_cov_252.773385_g869_i0.p1 GENE.NODE_1136_length_1086_cov_252.773385_g869_i0~~NODE_1136_length_1086_cov_252.773385_g869_i0.p1  ORF type:complete len:339 (-),score=119.16 NODE_1136_length_1086_cov_252.773385_g869_i0:69-1016(-)
MLKQVVKRSTLRSQTRGSAWNFQYSVEFNPPDYLGRPNRTGDDLTATKNALPTVEFMSSEQFNQLTKQRANFMGEFMYQRDLRLKITDMLLAEAPEKVPGLDSLATSDAQNVAQLKALQGLSEYAGELLEQSNQVAQTVNDFVDANHPFLLDQPLREEARWNVIQEMDNNTRVAVRNELRDWVPTEYRQVRAADIQTAAAFSPTICADMLKKVDERAKEAEADIAAAPKEAQPRLRELLKIEVEEAKKFVNPVLDITPAKVKQTTSLDELRTMAHRVTEHNGDVSLLLEIYARASELSKDTKGSELVASMRAAFA